MDSKERLLRILWISTKGNEWTKDQIYSEFSLDTKSLGLHYYILDTLCINSVLLRILCNAGKSERKKEKRMASKINGLGYSKDGYIGRLDMIAKS